MRSQFSRLGHVLSSCIHREATIKNGNIADSSLGCRAITYLWTRHISSSVVSLHNALEEPLPSSSKPKPTVNLKSRVFKLKDPAERATTALQNWVDEGQKVKITELRWISQLLVKAKRFKHAHEILTWMDKQKGFQMSAADHAIRVEVLVKVCRLAEAEEHFAKIKGSGSQKAACLPLLHGYVKERDTEKAEAFMGKLNNLGLLVNPHLFNEMMKLYMATSQCEKVHLVIQQIKQNKIPLNVLSYNLWMNACGEISDVRSAERVYREMVEDKSVEVGWSTLCTLANIYVKTGLVEKASLALKDAENKLSTHNRLGYFFLITLYASLNNRAGVLRIWEASKGVGGRITSANYMCLLLCLVKLGDLVEAERIFTEWESNCRKYDIRVSNVLLGAYMRNGMMDKAESLHLHTLERGGCPNYKTWEILMEGWVKNQNMDKAIDTMKKGFSLLTDCNWRPSDDILMAIAHYYEKCRNIKGADSYVKVLHHLGLATLSLYKLLLRMRLTFHLPVSEVLDMIEKDGVEIDGETATLLRAFNCN